MVPKLESMPIFDRRLLVNIGKGGVGKSTITAALALRAAWAGKRVLVCEVRTSERISRLLGAPQVGTRIGPLDVGIDGVVLDPQEAMREYGMMQLRNRALYRLVFENRWVSKFLGFLPSLPELVMLGKALYHVQEGRWDLVLLDSPATGHGVTFLGVPQALRDTLPKGPLRNEADWMQELLVDPATTATNLVTIPEELAVNETLELATSLRETMGLPLGGVFLNRFVSQRFSAGEIEQLAGAASSPLLDAATRAAQVRRLRADASTRYRDELTEKIEGLPLFSIPLLFPQGELGRGEIEAIASSLGGGP